MPYPCDGIPRPGLDIPNMKCPICGRGVVHWIDGGSWLLEDLPKPHFHCFGCNAVFAGKEPKVSARSLKEQSRRFESLWKSS